MGTGFWASSTRDKIHNGIFAGLVASAFLIWGNKIYSWILINYPNNWYFAGTWTVPIVILGAGAIIGGIIDKY